MSPSRYLAGSGGIFGCHRRRVATGISEVEDRDAVKNFTMHRIACTPITKNGLAPNLNEPRLRNPELESLFLIDLNVLPTDFTLLTDLGNFLESQKD